MIFTEKHPYDPEENFFKPERVVGRPKETKGKAAEKARSTRRAYLKPVSDKQRIRNKEYAKIRDEWFKLFQIHFHGRCQFVDDAGKQCSRRASRHPHHARGRRKHLCDTSTFMGVCIPCHRRIHDNPKFSYDKGYMIKRL